MSKEAILVTGASGFVGNALCRTLIKTHNVRAAVRSVNHSILCDEIQIVNCELSPDFDWSVALIGVSVVVHLAACIQMTEKASSDTLSEFRRINVDGTLRLAKQAVAAGVKRFIFISSIKVNGESTEIGRAFTEDDTPNPSDPYSISKAEAEQALRKLSIDTGIELTIIRPPLVYGPGVRGNFASILQAAQSGLPLPFGAVNNQRSLVALDNLVSLIELCSDRNRSPQAANQVFVISDGEDVSTSSLLRKLATSAGRSSRFVAVPVRLLRTCAILVGKRAVADRLLCNLQVDATKARTLLGWRPIVTLDQQLSKMFEQEK